MKIDLNTDFYKLIFMTSLSIEVLKKIVENIPDDYTLEFDNGKTTYNIDDKVEIDVSWKNWFWKSIESFVFYVYAKFENKLIFNIITVNVYDTSLKL